MFYAFIKCWVKLAIRLFCRSVNITEQGDNQSTAPQLLIANHPNSFLDGVLIAAFFKDPVYFLARGDAFQKKWQRRLLSLVNMYPVYRLSEGKEFLHLNEGTFRACQDVFKQKGNLLIFIEGICVRSHQLQPFKKGTARIVRNAWRDNINLTVVPVGIGYSSFSSFAKTVHIQYGGTICKNSFDNTVTDAIFNNQFNKRLYKEIDRLIEVPQHRSPNNILYKFAYLLHYLFYNPLKWLVKKKTANTVFYDAVLFALLWFLYPVFLLLIFLATWKLFVSVWTSIAITACFPALTWLSYRLK